MLKHDLSEVCRTRSFIIFIDEQLNESNGYLRSLHFLARLSEGKIRRVIIWEPGRNCNEPLDTSGIHLEFVHPSVFSPIDTLHCVFVNDEKEDAYSYVDKYVEFGVPSIFVLNHAVFIPKAWRLSAKPLESKCPYTTRYFQVELNKHLESTGLANFQLSETRNLAFTEICYFHHGITSERAMTLIDLFNFEDKRLAISPIWDWAINLLSLKAENRVTNVYAFVFNALRPLIEKNKDVTKVASSYESLLKSCRYKIEALRKTRKANFKSMSDNYLLLLKETSESFFRSLLKVQLEKLRCQ
jgi:hypothetical protein